MNNNEKNILINKLISIGGDYTATPLKRRVAVEILEHGSTDKDIKCFLDNLLQNGCISGMVGSLIYYIDTRKFYDEFYVDIEAMRLEYEEQTGEQLHPKENDLKNWFAWFGFEETARIIYDEIEADSLEE